jgi:hypothetical protein
MDMQLETIPLAVFLGGNQLGAGRQTGRPVRTNVGSGEALENI